MSPSHCQGLERVDFDESGIEEWMECKDGYEGGRGYRRIADMAEDNRIGKNTLLERQKRLYDFHCHLNLRVFLLL